MMKTSVAKEGSKREWVTVTGHEGIPEYNAISDPHCPVARTPAVLKLCEQHAAPMPQRKMKASSHSGSSPHTHNHHGHMCSRQKRAMDFIAKQKRYIDADGGANAQQQRPQKRLIKRWNLSTMDEQSDEEDINGNPIERKAASPPRRNHQIEQALENWGTIRDDINGCWAFYGINAGYIDRRRDEDRRLYEGVQKLYDREDEERQMEATVRDRNEKRTRFAKHARERQAKEEGSQPGSTANSRQRSVCGPSLSPRGSRQVEPKAPSQPHKGNPRNSSVGGTGASSTTASPTAPHPPIPKPPAKRNQFQSQSKDDGVPLAGSGSLFCSPSVSPVKVTTSSSNTFTTTTTTTNTTTTVHHQPSQQTNGAHGNKRGGGGGAVIPVEDNSPERVESSQQQQQQQQSSPATTTHHINDVMEGMNNSQYNAEEEL